MKRNLWAVLLLGAALGLNGFGCADEPSSGDGGGNNANNSPVNNNPANNSPSNNNPANNNPVNNNPVNNSPVNNATNNNATNNNNPVNNNPVCTDACPRDGATQCNADGAVETCAMGADGCLAWSGAQACDAGEACVVEDGAASCQAVAVCEDLCDEAGAVSCNADGDVEVCTLDDDGCLAPVVVNECAADETCEVRANGAVCVAPTGCENTCDTAGEVACSPGGDVVTCEADAQGCRSIQVTDACSDAESCVASASGAACEVVCDNTCDTEGATACNADGDVEACVADANGCLAPAVVNTCNNEETCEVRASGAVCVAPDGCENTCATPGALSCSAAGDVARCQVNAQGCRTLTTQDTCDADEVCVAAGGGATCEVVCDNTCDTEGATSCNADGDVEACVADADGCLSRVVLSACSDDETCEVRANGPVCVAPDGCENTCDTAGEVACSASGDVVTCEVDANGCRLFQVTDACSDAESCVASASGAACEVVCDNTCDTEGATSCNADGDVEACVADADGCLSSQVVNACTGDEVCESRANGAVCVEPAGCENTCDTLGAARCGAGGTVLVCTADAEGCRTLTTQDTCDADEVCVSAGGAATCEVVCDNTCDTEGATSCNADGDVEACVADADGCLALAVVNDCAAGEMCQVRANGPVCVAPTGCENTCDVLGASSCDANGDIVTCSADANGCRVATVAQECGANQRCVADGGVASCQVVCDDTCNVEGATRCNAAGDVETCTADANGCRAFVVSAECAADDVCEVRSGAASCISPSGCVNTCGAAGATRCNADGELETCTADAQGCRAYVASACDAGLSCQMDGGAASCVVECIDACGVEGSTVCNGDNNVETCVRGMDGCLELVETQVCGSRQICDDGSGAAECSCSNSCDAPGAAVCSADNASVERCAVDTDGCFYTEVTLCEGDTACVANGGDASCEAPLAGTCEQPIQVEGSSFFLSGDDIRDYGDTFITDNNASCDTGTGADIVFQVNANPGDTIIVRELGGLDSVLKLQESSCDAMALCFVDADLSADESEGIRFDVTFPGPFTLITSAYYATGDSRPWDYAVEIVVVPPETCGNGEDDDADGDADCDDQDCFGVAGVCDVEMNCGDGLDNDADGDPDCDDDECASSDACQPAVGLFERFSQAGSFDLTGRSVRFIPSASAPSGFTRSVNALPGGQLLYTPGNGVLGSQSFDLGDDDATEIVLPVPVTLFGQSYTTLYLGSNGFITLEAEDTTRSSSVGSFFEFPRIAGLDADLNPGAGGQIILDVYPTLATISFVNVPRYSTGAVGQTNTFQIVLFTVGGASGTIELAYQQVDPAITSIFVGLGDGDAANNAIYPDPQDFYMVPPVINEVMYDNPDTDTVEYVELKGAPGQALTGLTLVHHNGASNGAVIWSLPLDGVTIPADGYLVIGSMATPNMDVLIPNPLQSENESIVLYRDRGLASQTVVDAYAYEFTDNLANSYFGEGDADPGLPFGTLSTAVGRIPDGIDTGDNATDFDVQWFATPGGPNMPASPPSGVGNYVRLSGADNNANMSLPAAIPDNDPTGVSLTIPVIAASSGTVADVLVGLNLRHTYRGDLRVTLTSPAGTTVVLHDGTGGSAVNLVTIFDVPTPSAQSLDAFNGEVLVAGGVWTLNVSDNGGGDVGTLLDWAIWVDVTP